MVGILCYMLDLHFRYITLCGMMVSVYWPSNPRDLTIYNTGQHALQPSIPPQQILTLTLTLTLIQDNMHYNLAFHRNKSLAAGIPMWNYIWLSSNGPAISKS